MVTALAKTGGSEAGRWFRSLLAGSALTARDDRDLLVRRAVTEAWRLGKNAPVEGLLSMVSTTDDDLRWNIVLFTWPAPCPCGRPTHAGCVGRPLPAHSAAAARTLTKAYADSSRLDERKRRPAPSSSNRAMRIPASESRPFAPWQRSNGGTRRPGDPAAR